MTFAVDLESSGAGDAGSNSKLRNSVSTFASNSVFNVLRVGLSAVIALLLPIYLTHRLPIRTYGAWVLILQLAAYVGYLNLGVQTALSKFIAEYEIGQDYKGCGRCASVGLMMMLGAGVLGVVLTAVLALNVSRLFHDVSPMLLHDVQISVWLIGVALSLGLSTSVFSAIFLGLRRYAVPTAIQVSGRLAYAIVVCVAVHLRAGLVSMAAGAAAVTLLTSAAEFVAWWYLARHIAISHRLIDRPMVRRMLEYCSILTVWTACMLFIGGLDVTIVGHYAFDQVAFYSIANSPTNMILMIIGAVLGPLLPAASAYSVRSSPDQMGDLLLRSTRYSTLLLLLTGLPVLVSGYLLLRLWVGPVYALHSIVFLQILLLANIIRNLGAPYSTMVVATSRQRVGTASAVTEAVINLTFSIVLAKHIGAIGVALGTLIGAVTGVAMHFGVTMHYTRINFNISRMRLFLEGLLRPASAAFPTLLLVPLWWGREANRFSPLLWLAWIISTAVLFWYGGMLADDRVMLRRWIERLGARLFFRGPPVSGQSA